MLGTRGASWNYQHSETIQRILATQLADHFTAWQRKSTDKGDHPLFIVASGPGTGKSRLLQGIMAKNMCFFCYY